MVKKQRLPSYLSSQALINKGYYEQAEADKYKENRQKIQAMNLRERGNELSSEEKYRAAKNRYESGQGNIGTGGVITEGARAGIRKTNAFFARNLPKAYSTVSQRGGVTRALYRGQGQLPPTNVENRFKTIQGMKSGRKGRPVGTIDKRYAAYGGVYGYRKYVAQQNFLARQQALQSRAVSPQQQMILNQIRARQQYDNQNEEGKIIPNTRGMVFMDNIMAEIEAASNAVR